MNPAPGGPPDRSAEPANDAGVLAFYLRVLDFLQRTGIPFLVGGGFAVERYTGIERDIHDFDVFVLPERVRDVLQQFAAAGYRTRLTHRHWLGKTFDGKDHVDIIFSSGNGVVRVDQAWFDHAPQVELFGRSVRFCPIEETLWSKSFVMERERFDGADVLHLIRTGGATLDWDRLIERFGPFWRVLTAHLVLFGFVFPNERSKIPAHVMRDLISRLDEGDAEGPAVCMGTLLSRVQYQQALADGLRDGRLVSGAMTPKEIAQWTAAARRPRLGRRPKTR